MSRLRGFADLAGRRVGLYGVGVEGRATLARLASITTDVVLVDDHPDRDDVLASAAGGLDALASCDVVLKSPGVPARGPAITALRERGVLVTSALNLWLQETDPARVIAVTGTKGKSTTASLIAFALASCGAPVHLVGNIGQPPYDPALDLSTGWLVLEVSSFQCVDLDLAPDRIVLTALGADHLDWHGSLDQYWADKLSITRASGAPHVFAAHTPDLVHQRHQMGGTVTYVDADDSDLTERLSLLGDHSHRNVALALAVVANATQQSVAEVRAAVRDQASTFVPLRGRLTLVRTAHGVRFVDDGLATSALPTIAALEVFADEPVALIVGGFDRGVDYTPLLEAVQRRSDLTIVTMGPAGERIALALAQRGVAVSSVEDLTHAVDLASRAVRAGGVVLFSPAAPSFDRYRNWLERSEDFARAANSTDPWSLGGESNP